MSSISVAVISKETLSTIGLKHLLQNLFDISPILFKTWNEKEIANQDNFDLYITSMEEYVENIDFFIPRRNKTLILGTDNINHISRSGILNCNANEDAIVEQIKTTIEQIEQNTATTHNELSQREIDVLKLIATGCLNKEIADKLNISINTVLTHRKNITSKLEIRSVSGLSFYAMMNGYVSSV